MRLFQIAKRKPGWLCINLMPDRVDLSHVVMNGKARPQVLLCDSYRTEGDDFSTLKRLRRELDLGSYRCTTLLKAADYQVLQVDAPNVPAAELKAAVRWSLKDLIDYPVEAATVDAVQIPGGGNQKVLAVAARNDAIFAVVKPFNDTDIPLEVIDVPELAQRNVAHCYEEPGRGLVLLTFNEQGGLLTFTCDGELYQSRRTEVTPANFVDADADERRRLYDRIVLELQRTLDNFDRQFHSVAVSKVMVTPIPGADDMQEYLAANLDVPVVLLDLAQVMDFPRVPELLEPGRQMQCVQMIGAAMRAGGAA